MLFTGEVDPGGLTEALQHVYDTSIKTDSEERRIATAALVKKWAWYMGESISTGGQVIKLKPIPVEHWATMAMLFENQVRNNPVRSLYEATTTSNFSLPNKFTLPVIREIFPALIMMKICSVQAMPPMSGGVAKAFWWKTWREDVSPTTQLTTSDSDYALGEENSVPKRISATLTSATITAIKDILAATWSTEAEEDLRGVMGMDIENEMLSAMAQEILRELEQRVLMEILTGATAGDTAWSWTKPATYATHRDWYETLYHAVLDAEANVMNVRETPCNYIIAGTTALSYLLKSAYWGPRQGATPGSLPFEIGTRFEGTFGGRWDVYRSPYITATKMIVSFYPRGPLHGGYIWLPYIPITPMPKAYAEFQPYDDATLPGAFVNTDKWTRNIRTRYGKYMCAPDMFATVTVSA